MTEINWRDTLEVLYGTPVSDRLVKTWDHYLLEMNATNAEIIEAIEYANARKIKVKYRATASDVIEWITDIRLKKASEGLKTAFDERTKRIADKFADEWRGKFSEGFTVEQMEEAACKLPLSTPIVQRIIDNVLAKRNEHE